MPMRMPYGSLAMRIHLITIRLIAAVLVAMTPLTAADRQAPQTVAQPSKNSGRAGIYQVPTSIAAYNYHVCVPTSYDGTKPAGLHVFFHGQNNQGAAKEWERWQKPFLEQFRLIGINLEYTDGDNGRDTEGKVKAAQEAIAQVTADYKVVQRGAVACFSGGGIVHGLMAEQFGLRDPTPCVPMSWCIAIGTDEWTLADLGRTAVARTGELYQATAKGGTPDIRFFMTRKGHTITSDDIAASANAFTYSDLAFGAFLFPGDFPEKELRGIVEQANRQQLGLAAAAVSKLLAKTTVAEPLRSKAMALQTHLEERQKQVVALLQTLPTNDPVCATWYGPLLLAQLKGHAQEKELKTALITALKTKDAQAAATAHGELARHFATLFGAGGSNPGVVADKRELLTGLHPHLPATSRAALVVGELLSIGR
jgi:hypothetical protein